jgi:hypothetical protein
VAQAIGIRRCVKYGSLYRLDYQGDGQSCDLREETELSVDWGDRGQGVPDWLEPYAAQHKVKDRIAIGSATKMGLLIQAAQDSPAAGMRLLPPECAGIKAANR